MNLNKILGLHLNRIKQMYYQYHLHLHFTYLISDDACKNLLSGVLAFVVFSRSLSHILE